MLIFLFEFHLLNRLGLESGDKVNIRVRFRASVEVTVGKEKWFGRGWD